MTPDDALSALQEVEVIPCVEAALPQAKELQEACLDADIPVVLGPASCAHGGGGGCGCGPKLALLAREEDVRRIATLLGNRWSDMVEREGLGPGDADLAAVPPADANPGAAAEGDEPPCPACGATAALVEGACPDCGLQLG